LTPGETSISAARNGCFEIIFACSSTLGGYAGRLVVVVVMVQWKRSAWLCELVFDTSAS